MAATAGFIFGKDTSLDTRNVLMLFIVTISVVSCAAWVVGLRWVKDFTAAFERVKPEHSPPLALRPFRIVIIIGFVGSVVITGGPLLLYLRGV